MEEVLPLFMRSNKMSNFRRQLHFYGIETVPEWCDGSLYMKHPRNLFRRDDQKGMEQMVAETKQIRLEIRTKHLNAVALKRPVPADDVTPVPVRDVKKERRPRLCQRRECVALRAEAELLKKQLLAASVADDVVQVATATTTDIITECSNDVVYVPLLATEAKNSKGDDDDDTVRAKTADHLVELIAGGTTWSGSKLDTSDAMSSEISVRVYCCD